MKGEKCGPHLVVQRYHIIGDAELGYYFSMDSIYILVLMCLKYNISINSRQKNGLE